MSPSDYHLGKNERLREAIARSWNRLVGVWESFRSAADALPDSDTGTSLTRERWLLILFQELGFGRLQASKSIDINGRDYPVSHSWGSVPVHLVSFRFDLDRRTAGAVGAARAPHSMVQELLNRSDDHLWAIVSNGLTLRVLRDNLALTRQAYVEFDLEGMMDGEQYSDFALLWLLCHQSRFEGDVPEASWIEQWVTVAHQEGTRALDQLREGVERALTVLGTGFLTHPSNRPLRSAIETGELTPSDFYRQLLRLVYRLLFLFVTEDRDLLLIGDTKPEVRERYVRFYSTQRLRELAGEIPGSKHGDLWQTLRLIMGFLGADEGCTELAIPSLGGFLWGSEALGLLEESELANSHLLEATRHLAYRSDDRVRRPVDYRNLGSEELGSVYEALLELHPDIDLRARRFGLGVAAGSERKTTGSYYTPTTLINLILDEALEPVVAKVIAGKTGQAAETAILDLKLCDPAVGSAHFLVAAAHRLARHLAAARSGEGQPSPYETRLALRDVVRRCLYGVDINPMAVELAKISLWLEATVPGMPLTFLDHHIKCGNSIVGATPALIQAGIPDEAFRPIEGDDKATARSLKTRNARLRRGQASLEFGVAAEPHVIRDRAMLLNDVVDNDPETLHTKERLYSELESSEVLRRERTMADAWCATLTYPKTRESSTENQPFDLFYALRDGGDTRHLNEGRTTVAHEADRYGFFHWHLEYPDVFSPGQPTGDDDRCGWTGGFDLVFGNPPWDKIGPDAREFFGRYDPELATVGKNERDSMVSSLLEEPHIARAWIVYRRQLATTAKFFRYSGRYRLFARGHLGKGELNIYRAFVELALTTTVRTGGAAAQIVPAGIYNGANAAAIRDELFTNWQLRSLWGFNNGEFAWFPTIAATSWFAIYIASAGEGTTAFRSAFDLRTLEDLSHGRSTPHLYSVDDIRRVDPEASLIPQVTAGRDSAIIEKMTRGFPTFQRANEQNSWHPYRKELDMTNDSHLFHKDPSGIPLYEGRMIEAYDHRAKRYVSGSGRAAKWQAESFSSELKALVPQWFVARRDIPNKVGNAVDRYRIGFLDITNPNYYRCLRAAAIPPGTVCGNQVPTISFPDGEEWRYALWLAWANSFAVDYLVRKRVSLHMSFTAMNSLPFPDLKPGSDLGILLIDRVLRLTCVSQDMQQFRNLVLSSASLRGDLGKPAAIDADDRAVLEAETNALVAGRIFGLTRDELAFVLETFTALKRAEGRQYDEFRTKRLVLGACERMLPAGGGVDVRVGGGE